MNTMELNRNEMEMINGGFDLKRLVTMVGLGVAGGSAAGSIGGPIGALTGAAIGGVAGAVIGVMTDD